MAQAQRDKLNEAQQQQLDDWLSRVLHDLVKYLEMMPRSLDWDDLEEDDADVLYEAIFETRVARQETLGAQELWASARGQLPEELAQALAPCWEGLDQEVQRLVTLAQPLRTGQGLDGVDVPRLRQALFSIGDRLRALRR